MRYCGCCGRRNPRARLLRQPFFLGSKSNKLYLLESLDRRRPFLRRILHWGGIDKAGDTRKIKSEKHSPGKIFRIGIYPKNLRFWNCEWEKLDRYLFLVCALEQGLPQESILPHIKSTLNSMSVLWYRQSGHPGISR